MAEKWSKILSPKFILMSIQKKGVVDSLIAGLNLVYLRINHVFFSSRIGRAVNVLLNINVVGDKPLYAFYDLAKAANGFDFFNFLVLAELYRRRNRYNGIHIVIVLPREQQYKTFEDYKTLGVTDFYARLQNIIMPGYLLLPSSRGMTVCNSREEANRIFDSAQPNIFPEKYTVRAPIAYVKPGYIRKAVDQGEIVPSLQAPPLAKKAAEAWLQSVAKGKKVVTITLRESTYAEEKNSILKNWVIFADNLRKSENYFPVFIRDTEQVLKDLPAELRGFTVSSEASLNILFRSALYEVSYLNLFVNNGPVVLSVLNRKSRYIIFKFVNAANKKASKDFLRENHGIDYGESVPGATPLQKLVWEDDTFEVINREFVSMCKLIEKSN